MADAAIRRDPEWIANISTSGPRVSRATRWSTASRSRLEGKGALTPKTRSRSATTSTGFRPSEVPFHRPGDRADGRRGAGRRHLRAHQQRGRKLNQADFILTLLSVFWDKGRRRWRRFCRQSRRAPGSGRQASPFNHFIEPDPDQLLRVAVAWASARPAEKRVSDPARQGHRDRRVSSE